MGTGWVGTEYVGGVGGWVCRWGLGGWVGGCVRRWGLGGWVNGWVCRWGLGGWGLSV